VDPCENRTPAEPASPGANKRAVVFERSCGATTGFSTHVSVLDSNEAPPQSAGNVFDADSDHGAIKDMTVTVRWLSRDQIVIRYPTRARIFRKEAQARGIAVAYETTP
jgi:hypothetical protein